MRANTLLISDVLRHFEQRILTEFIDLLVLSTLYCQGGSISGYEIIKYVQTRYHFLLSPGTVYSRLYDMERKGLLRGKHSGKKRVYTLTWYGKEVARAILNGKDRILKFISMIF